MIRYLIKKIQNIFMKKDTNYTSPENTYGDFEWRYISSATCGDLSNIILELDYTPTPSMDNFKSDLLFFKKYANQSGLRMIEYSFQNKTCVLVAGSAIQYVSVFSIDKTGYDNTVLRSLLSLLIKIDVVSCKITDYLDYGRVVPAYESTDIMLTESVPVWMQTINESLLYKEITRCDYNKDLIYLTVSFIYNLFGSNCIMYYNNELLLFTIADTTGDYIRLINSFASNFDIPRYQNLFDINLKVTNDSDESLYDNIDEVID